LSKFLPALHCCEEVGLVLNSSQMLCDFFQYFIIVGPKIICFTSCSLECRAIFVKLQLCNMLYRAICSSFERSRRRTKFLGHQYVLCPTAVKTLCEHFRDLSTIVFLALTVWLHWMLPRINIVLVECFCCLKTPSEVHMETC